VPSTDHTFGTASKNPSHFLGEFTVDLSLSGLERGEDVDEITEIISPERFSRKDVLFDIE
jgi:hypothetical protein